MAIEHMLWALAETIRAGVADPEATPAFAWRIGGFEALPITGYGVAYRETQNQSGRGGLEIAVTHARDHACIVGGRVRDDRVYFDSLRIYRDRAAAMNAARRNGQTGIYSLLRQEYVPVTDPDLTLVRGSPAPFPPRARDAEITGVPHVAVARLNRSRRSPQPRPEIRAARVR